MVRAADMGNKTIFSSSHLSLMIALSMIIKLIMTSIKKDIVVMMLMVIWSKMIFWRKVDVENHD